MKQIYVLIATCLVLSACGSKSNNNTTPNNAPISPKVVRIMELGDSITMGYGSCPGDPSANTCGGYRTVLASLIDNPNIQYVGSLTNGGFSHEGHSGYYIVGHTSNGTYGKGLLENVQQWLTDNPPDVILLHIGTNTLASQYPVPNAGLTSASELRQLLTAIEQYAPQARVVMSSIIPLDQSLIGTFPQASFDEFQGAINSYNTAMRSVVQEFPSMIFVDMNAEAGLINGDYFDMAHPNVSGYTKMANVWYKALSGSNLLQ